MSSPLILPDHLCEHFEKGRQLRAKGYRGRFAPSPTGPLHLGNLRTALISWLKARVSRGLWLLRIDDLDTPRNRPGAIHSLQQDLLWLGLSWDGPVVFQSRRLWLYSAVLKALRVQGKLYVCRCSRKKLAANSTSNGTWSIYPGTCKDLNLDWGYEKDLQTSWRLRVADEFSTTCGDIVLRRSDGFIAYHLATVIDELTLGISEVIRGEDLTIAEVPQLAIANVITETPIHYLYAPLLLDDQGGKMSKRNNEFGLDSLKAQGLAAEEVVGLLASSLNLVPQGSALTADELLCDLKRNEEKDLDCLLS